VRSRQPGVREAVVAAVLFGAATPFASRLVADASPQVIAGLLYLGSGLVLGASMLVWPTHRQAPLTRPDIPALAGAVLFGGALGPLLLMVGLRTTPASTASLLLNLEVVFTALIAWLVFHERIDRRLALGFVFIVAGGVIVSWSAHGSIGLSAGAVAVIAACGCWALDNNLTQKVSAKDPRQIACIKGLVAGSANLGIGVALGAALPSANATVSAMGIGVVGYGISLMLFVTALRSLGSARTSAYFAVAPFIGVVVAIAVFGEPFRERLWPAGALIAAGIWLHMAELHEHRHVHEALAHSHAHVHDDLHHVHTHAGEVDSEEPHVHEHKHAATVHAHPHRPDVHYRHR
jgi:drug/metabolite transporter (DMT)-like permease